MPAYNRPYIILDVETTGTDCLRHDVTQLAAVILDGLTLEPIRNGEFNSMVRPENWDTIDAEALRITGFTIEQLKEAPPQAMVWGQFKTFLNKFNPKKTRFFAPCPVGYNVNFDMGFLTELAKKYGDWDENRRNIKILGFPTLDVYQLIYLWFEQNPDIKNLKLDTLREYFEWPKDKAHDALHDVRFTAEIFRRFTYFQRKLHTKNRFKGCFGASKSTQ